MSKLAVAARRHLPIAIGAGALVLGGVLASAGSAGAADHGSQIRSYPLGQRDIGADGVSGHAKTAQSEIQGNSLNGGDIDQHSVSGSESEGQSELKPGTVGWEDLSREARKRLIERVKDELNDGGDDGGEPQCNANDFVRFAALGESGKFQVSKSGVTDGENRSVVHGDHVTLTAGENGDADVLSANAHRLSQLVNNGRVDIPVSTSHRTAEVSVNLWFNVNHPDRIFDLNEDVTGTFTSLNGDTYAHVNADGESLNWLTGNLTDADGNKVTGEVAVADLLAGDYYVNGKQINSDTKVLFDVVAQDGSVEVESFRGDSLVTCE